MPGKRIPDLPAIAGASTANDDNLVIFDTDASTTKRILRSQLAAGLVGDLPYTPSGGISATTVPTAIAELDTEKTTLSAVLARLDDVDGSSLSGYMPAGITGTAQAGASTTITLASGASATDDAYNGLTVQITGGTGSGQVRTISDYVGSTKVATVSTAWTTTPDATSIYNIAYPRTAQSKMRDVVSVKDFGAVGDGVADDSSAIQNACAAIQAAGGGTLYFPKGTYNIACPISGTFYGFSNLDGVALIGDGVVVNDTTSYASAQTSLMFTFTACKNVNVGRGMRLVSQADNVNFTTDLGVVFFRFLQGCQNIDVDADVYGGLNGVHIYREYTDPVSYRCGNIFVKLRAERNHYPYLCRFSGDVAQVFLDANGCGRNFFLYGATQQKIWMRSIDQKVTSLIKAYSGFGCSDIEVWSYDRDSTSCQPAAEHIAIHYGDATAATHRNIKIHLDVKNNTTAPWGNTILIAKYAADGTTPDTTGRGHVLDGFEITGRSEQVGSATHFVQNVGAFAAPDVQRSIRVGNLTLGGGGNSFSMNMPNAASPVVFDNVYTDHNIYSTAPKTVFIACSALSFTSGTSDSNTHDYIDCEIRSGALQNYVTNKSYRNTVTPLGVVNANSVQAESEFVAARAVKQLRGDLTGTTNIFRIPPSQTGVYRLTYYLVADNGDFDPATRKEVFGVKSFSIPINSGGAGDFNLGVANYVTERTDGASPAVLTIGKVNGNATDGLYITASATNYNGANATATFVLELLAGGTGLSRVYPT